MVETQLQNTPATSNDPAVNSNPSLKVTLPPQQRAPGVLSKQDELDQTKKDLSHRFSEIVGQMLKEKIATEARSSGLRFNQLPPEDQQAITELAKVKYPSAENITQLKDIVDRYLKKPPGDGDLDKGYFAAAFDDKDCGAGIEQYVKKISQLEPEAKAERRADVISYRNSTVEEIYKSLPEETRKALDQTCSDRTTDESALKILAEAKKYAATLTDLSGFITHEKLVGLISTVQDCHTELGVVAPVETTPSAPSAPANQQQVAEWERDYYNNRIIAGNDPEKSAGGLNKVLAVLDPEALKAINEKKYDNLEDKISDMVKAFHAAASKMEGLRNLSGAPTMDPRVGEFLRQDPNGKFALTDAALVTMEAVSGQKFANPQSPEAQSYMNAVKELRENQVDKEHHFRNNPQGTPLPPTTNQQQQAQWELSYYNNRLVEGNSPATTLGGLNKILSVIAPDALKLINEQYTSNSEEKISAMVKAFQAAANKDSRLVNLMSSRPDAVEFLKQDPSSKFTLTEGAIKTMEGFAGIMLGDPKLMSETANYGAAVRELRENFTDKTTHFRNNPEGSYFSAQTGLANSAINALKTLVKDPVPAGATQAETLTNLLKGLQSEIAQGSNRFFREGRSGFQPALIRFMNQNPPVLDADAIETISAFAGKVPTTPAETASRPAKLEAVAKLREDFISSKMEALIDSIVPGTVAKLDQQYATHRNERLEAMLKAFQEKLKDPSSEGFRNLYGATHPEIARFAAANPPKLDADALAVLATFCGQIRTDATDPLRTAQLGMIIDIRRVQGIR